MSNLLDYLVERSVRSRPVAEPAAEGERPGPRAGALRPRLPGRYQRQPGPLAGPDTASLAEIEAEEPTPPLRTARAIHEQPAGPPGEGTFPAPRTAGPPDEPAPLTRRSTGAELHQPVTEHRGRQEEPPAVQRAASRDDGGRAPGPTPRVPGLEPRPVPAASHEAQPPAARPAFAAPEIRPRPAPLHEIEQPPRAAVEPVREAQAPVPGVRPRPQEPAVVRVARQAPAQAAAPAREPGDERAPGPARQPVEPPLAPRIQVSIGRVEVRAVYAPPPAPGPPPPRPGPAMSLDDYLKQRDGGS